MQGYFTRKKTNKNEPRPSEHPPVVGGKTNTEYTGSLGYNSVFRVCYITSIDVDNSMFARLGTDYEIRNQWVLEILEAMATD